MIVPHGNPRATAYDLDRAGAQPLPAAYAWTAHAPTGLRYHDWFCGAGGSSLGLTAAGMTLALAANHWDRAIDDCLFRMLSPEEHLAAQRFHSSYVVLGNKGERTMQAGNAVSSNVAQWLGAAVAAALCGGVA